MTTAAGRRPRLLVVDDDESLVALYAEELTEEGYDVVVARSGDAALARLEDSSPDVVALDIRMPGLDGIETLRVIKARRPRLPVVLNTAYGAYKSNFGSWACDAYVVKSSDLTELKAALRGALECAERSAGAGGTPRAGADQRGREGAMPGPIETARAGLLERRRALLATQARVETELKGLEDEVEVEVLDKGQEETVARILSRLDTRARREVEEIDAAIGRIDAGVYGICERCGEAIPAARLAALPTTRLCLACAEAQEGEKTALQGSAR